MIEKNSPKEQLFLPVQTRLNKEFDTYLGEKNQHVVRYLKHYVSSLSEPLLLLTGRAGVGKSHLLEASIHFASQSDSRNNAAYFSLSELLLNAELSNSLTELSDYFESLTVLALDDLDIWLAQLEDCKRADAELFLFNLYNEYKTNGKLLLIASKCPVSHMTIQLDDLRSRLASGLLITLDELGDDDKRKFLQEIAHLKGFTMDDEVSSYILKRSGRDVASLLSVIEALDKATLMEQKKLTVPFVKKVFNW